MSPASSCDVLVIGAGPAGSAAARSLALAGATVVLVDQRPFPRDKVCGDALIRDSLGGLVYLGVDEIVRREAWRGDALRVYAPGGAHITLHGEFACLPRERLDMILLEAAVAAGATHTQGTAIAPLLDGDRVTGARFKNDAGEWSIVAPFTILATGANVTMLDAFGMNASKKPDAVAGRAYYVAPPDLASELTHLSIVYQRGWCPGYGWIFPGPGGQFNIGVALFTDGAIHGRLHQFFDEFCRTFPPAARLIEHSTLTREFRGAPIRSGLNREAFGRPGLLAVGEAVATTYAATGEGIGKAMESGILAAEVVETAWRGRRAVDGMEDAYRRKFERRFGGRYRAYDVAERWARSPLLLNLLAWRAKRGRFMQRELEALVAERGNPAALFSWVGLLKALVL
jgi:menaquinone-9 beta-reductase